MKLKSFKRIRNKFVYNLYLNFFKFYFYVWIKAKTALFSKKKELKPRISYSNTQKLKNTVLKICRFLIVSSLIFGNREANSIQ